MSFLFDLHTLVPLAILVPLIGALIISRLDSEPNVREGVTLITASILLFINIIFTICFL